KTKQVAAKLKELNLEKVLIVTEEIDEKLYLAARNLPHVDVVDVAAADPVSLVAFDKVLVTVSALRKFEEKLA
ncbi:MAG: 50S ribosomal protein L4, partial [Vreelandella alkaliphila]